MPHVAHVRAPHHRPRTRPPAGAAAGREDDLVVHLLAVHGPSALRLARRMSYCEDDAHDAYQRAVEILLRSASRLDPERAGAWLRTVAKHEALAVRRERQRAVPVEPLDADRLEARHVPSPEERADGADRVARAADALQGLKPAEARALGLRAAGLSYREIGERCGWSHTKVNRLLVEGRAAFLRRFAGLEAGALCEDRLADLSRLVDGDLDDTQRAALGTHLRACGGCRAALRALRDGEPSLRVLLPLPVAATAAAPPGGGDRLLDVVLAAWHERAGLTLLKAQMAADALSAGKVAAVAASAVAIGGGAALVVHERPDARHRPPATLAASVERSVPAAPPAAPATVPGQEGAAGPPAAAADTGAAATAAAPSASARPRTTGGDFGPEARATARPATSAGPPTRGHAGPPAEFDATAAAPAAPATAAGATSTSAPSGAGAEFSP